MEISNVLPLIHEILFGFAGGAVLLGEKGDWLFEKAAG